jgi:2-(1,2-epoxy-1,2-dihydrophenyl)acetyl-CoA isomerase
MTDPSTAAAEGSTPEPVQVTRDGAVATLTLNRPEAMNSLDTATKEALLAALLGLADDTGVRCVVITGSGRAFCVGQDLREHSELLATRPLDEVWATVDRHYGPIASAIATMDKPVIAAVNGVAAGAGMSIALACDLRIAADTASFNTAFTGVALSCDTGSSWFLPRLVGPAKALELLLMPRSVKSAEALELGLVSSVAPAADLAAEAAALAGRLAQGPTLAYAAVKQSVAYAATHSLDEALAFESRRMAETGGSDDHRNAVQSFLAKEQPGSLMPSASDRRILTSRRSPMNARHQELSRRAASRVAAAVMLTAALVVGEVSTTAATHPVGVLGAAQSTDRAHPAKVAPKVQLPDAIGVGPKVRQLITVSARGWDSNYAVLKAWRRKPDDSWTLARGPVHAVVGYNGWVRADDRVQSTGTTPAGKFSLPYAFGRWANPGAKLDYRRVDANDWWPYEPRDSATYNVYQFHRAKRTDWRGGYAERLYSYTKQYGYAMVVGFNLPHGIRYSSARKQWVASERADTRRGGGIFLHIRGDGFTAGCVAMSRADMRWLVEWVRPSEHARVVMGPHDYIVNL